MVMLAEVMEAVVETVATARAVEVAIAAQEVEATAAYVSVVTMA